ncbi:MAG: lysophospholipid acyltransferase family protein [Muribaculaceae bacterium]|nr:lysophospholipid acyltransferase family protein [Muribaculaceae bacterium]
MKRMAGWFFGVLALLPMWLLYGMSDVAALVLRSVVRYRRRAVRENLSASFPDKSEAELRRIERAFYRHFADNAVESIKTMRISEAQMRRRMEFEGAELIDRLFAEGRDIVAYFSHCGNWEWATSVALHTHARAGADADFGFVYRPLKNPTADAIMLRIRRRFGASAYPKATVFRELVRMRGRGQRFITGFMSDQKPSHGDPTYVGMFLNHPTAMITGTETVARKLDTAVVYWDMYRVRRGHYRVVCRLVCESAASLPPMALTEQYMHMLEHTICRNPSIWLWSHRRWKYPVKLTES